jgi:hypothetical protein
MPRRRIVNPCSRLDCVRSNRRRNANENEGRRLSRWPFVPTFFNRPAQARTETYGSGKETSVSNL